MKKTYLLVLTVVILSIPMAAQIAYVGGTTAGGGCTTSLITGSGTCPVTYSPTTGNAVALFFRPEQAATTSYAQDTNLYTMLQGSAVSFNSGYSLQSFATFAQTGATSYTVTGMATANGIVLGEYSGVLSINWNPSFTCPGNTVTGGGCTGTGTLASETVTLDEANDWAVCAQTQGGTNGGGTIQAPFTGNLRESYSTAPSLALIDNTSATTSVTVAGSFSASTTWRFACIEMRTVANPQTFNIAQITPPGYGSLTGPTTCTVTALTCTWQIAPTKRGSLLVWAFSDHSDFNDIQRTIVSLYTCTALTGGVCDGIHSNVDIATLPGSVCQAYVQDAQPESNSDDTAYVLSGGGGAIYVTGTRSGANATSERQSYALFEITPSIGQTFVFDACGSASVPTLSSSFNITGVSLTGTNDVVVQGITGGVFPMAITAPYTLQGESIPNHQGFWVGLGVNSGTAPTISVAGASDGAAGVARAFKLQVVNATTSKVTLQNGTIK